MPETKRHMPEFRSERMRKKIEAMDENAMRERLGRNAQLAKQILDNELFREEYEDSLQVLFEGFLETNPADVERERDAKMMAMGLKKFFERIENHYLIWLNTQED